MIGRYRPQVITTKRGPVQILFFGSSKPQCILGYATDLPSIRQIVAVVYVNKLVHN